MRNVYYVFINPKENTTEILNHKSGEIKTESGIDVLTHINVSQKAIVFTNMLFYIKIRYPGGESDGEDYVKFGQHETISYEYGNVTFRNIACFTNGQSESVLKDLFPDLPITAAMQHFIMSFNANPEKVKFTLGYNCKKMFYDPIKEKLWNEKKSNKAYYYNMQTYNDMMVANKAGALSYHQAYAEDVLCYDKRSAYASVILNDNHFPIGKMAKIEFDCGDKAKDLVLRYLKEDKYFKIVLDYKVSDFEIFYEEESKKSGLERENILDIAEDGLFDKFFENITCGRIYKCAKTGYCSSVLRKAVHDAYLRKESATGSEKFFLKTILNINIYGKSIQNYDFKDTKELQRHYRGRGDNYINPEMGLHCQAVLQHEIHNAQRNSVPVYWDTDGIKVKDTPEARKYFEDQNNLILKKNEESGFPCNIGTWKLESVAKRFATFGAKRYMFEDENGQFEMTWSGMTRDDRNKIVRYLDDDKIGNALTRGIPDIHKLYYVEDNSIKEVATIQIIKFEGEYLCPKKRNQKDDTLKSLHCERSIQKHDTTSCSAVVEQERHSQPCVNVSKTTSTEKEFLRMYADIKNRSEKLILTTSLERTMNGLMSIRKASGIRSFIGDHVSTLKDGCTEMTARMKRKNEILSRLAVHGR